jgi:hypothetical protein
MTESPGKLLDMRFGGAAVAANLQRAVETGALIDNGDGTLQLRPVREGTRANWMVVPNGPLLECDFLFNFLFVKAYARSAVPHGCRECYKVKVAPRTLRELVAAWQIAKRIECRSKWGIDLGNPLSQNVYAGYFYTVGLEGARAVFKVVGEALAADPKLGPNLSLTIKRGCSEYEAAVGPSDRYEFTPEMAELEAYLKARFRARSYAGQSNVALAFWIDFAFRIGDDTYLDFTGGKRLRPKTVTYDP